MYIMSYRAAADNLFHVPIRLQSPKNKPIPTMLSESNLFDVPIEVHADDDVIMSSLCIEKREQVEEDSFDGLVEIPVDIHVNDVMVQAPRGTFDAPASSSRVVKRRKIDGFKDGKVLAGMCCNTMMDGTDSIPRWHISALTLERKVTETVPQINIDKSSENHTEIKEHSEIHSKLFQRAQEITYSRFTSILKPKMSVSAIVPWFDTTNLINVPIQSKAQENRSSPIKPFPRVLKNKNLFEVPIQLHPDNVIQAPLETFDAPASIPHAIKRPRTSRSRRVNIDPISLPFMWRRLKKQEANRIRQRKFRRSRTTEQRIANRVRERLRQRRYRRSLTVEQRAAVKARDAARRRDAREHNRVQQTEEQRAAAKAREAARRREARLRQTEEERIAARALATARKRESRERNRLRQTEEQQTAARAIAAARRRVARDRIRAQRQIHSSNPVEALWNGREGIGDNQVSTQPISGVNGTPTHLPPSFVNPSQFVDSCQAKSIFDEKNST